MTRRRETRRRARERTASYDEFTVREHWLARPGMPGFRTRYPVSQPMSRYVSRGIQPIISADELVFPGVWESDEELDEFLTDLYASRRATM